jgi:hypothetical protein
MSYADTSETPIENNQGRSVYQSSRDHPAMLAGILTLVPTPVATPTGFKS